MNPEAPHAPAPPTHLHASPKPSPRQPAASLGRKNQKIRNLSSPGGLSNVLEIATGSPYQIAETPTFDLSTATTATITFDYGDTNGGSTRFMSVDFWNGSNWVDVSGNINHNTVNQNFSYTVTTGFAANNKFRFEGKNAGGGGTQYSLVDNVTITAIPEPSAALVGLLCLIPVFHRRR